MLAFSRSYDKYDWKPCSIHTLEEFMGLVDFLQRDYESTDAVPGIMLCVSDEDLPNLNVAAAKDGWVVVANMEIDGEIIQLRLDEGRKSQTKFMVYWDEMEELEGSWLVSIGLGKKAVEYWLKHCDTKKDINWIETEPV